MPPPDPFTGLPAFLAVAEAGGFTGATARLGVSPAAVSQAVKALEGRLGTLLFVRTTRRVGLTEAGAALLARSGRRRRRSPRRSRRPGRWGRSRPACCA